MATRDSLLRAARELFARHGYDGTSVRAITARAGANLGAITYHFGTKAHLYDSVLESVTQPLLLRLRQSGTTARSPLDDIEGVVRALFAHWVENPDWPALITHELALERTMPGPARHTMQEVAAMVSGLVRAGQRQRQIVAGDPLLLTFSIVSQPMYLALVRRKLRDALRLDADAPEVRAQFVEHVVAFVRRSLAAPRRAA
jgi:AcrR family transcriptional regulator